MAIRARFRFAVVAAPRDWCKRGLARAALFDWTRRAQATAALYAAADRP